MALHGDVVVDSVLFMASEAQATAWTANGGTEANIGQVFIFGSWAYVETAQNSNQYDLREVTVNLAPDHLGLGGGIAYPGILNIEGVGYWYFSESNGIYSPYVSPGSLCYLLYMYPSGSPSPLYELNYHPEGGTTQNLSSMGFNNQYVIFNTNGLAYYRYDSNGVLMPVSKIGNNVVLSGTYYSSKGYLLTNTSLNGDNNTTKISIPIDPSETYSYDEFRNTMESWIDDINPSLDEPLDIDDILPLTYSEYASEPTEPTEDTSCGCSCHCQTTINVDAQGNVTLNNDGDVVSLSIQNDADMALNLTAAAGAFGAGAIVIDPDANINLAAGAFGAGAFGAGAIANVDVDGNIVISGDADFSGSVSIGASEVSFSGGDINIDQSGGTNYNTYNNYYGSTEQDPEEPEQAFTIDYDEILGEDELESILNQETYELATFPTESDFEIDTIETFPVQIAPLPSEVVTSASALVDYGSNVISDVGFLPVYTPLALFSFACYVLRGGK